MSNSLDPDQARHFVGPDLGPNSLQKISADHTSRHALVSSGARDNSFGLSLYILCVCRHQRLR